MRTLLEVKKVLKASDTSVLSSWNLENNNCLLWKGISCNSKGEVEEM